MGYYKPETITRALVALRAELIRDGGPGLEHVEALLQIRGHNLGPVPRKAKTPARFRRNRLRVAIYAALRAGPLTGPEIVRRVAETHGIAYGALYRSVYAQLHEMRTKGQVENRDGLWWLPNCTLSAGAASPECEAAPELAPSRRGVC